MRLATFAFAAGIALGAAVSTSPAQAEEGVKCKGPIAIIKVDAVEGPLDRALTAAKPAECEVERVSSVPKALRDLLAGKGGAASPAIIANVRAYLRELNRSDVALVAVFATKKGKRGIDGRIFIFDKTGSLLSEEAVSYTDVKAAAPTLGEVTRAALADAAVHTSAPPAEKVEGPPVEPPSDLHRASLVDLRLGVIYTGRWFGYSGASDASLRTYSMVGKPSLSAELAVHPFAHSDGGLSGLGATASLRRSLGAWPSTLGGKSYDTVFEAWDIFVHYRYTLNTKVQAKPALETVPVSDPEGGLTEAPPRPTESTPAAAAGLSRGPSGPATYVGGEVGHVSDRFRFSEGAPAVAPDAYFAALAVGAFAQLPAGPVAVQLGARLVLPYAKSGAVDTFPKASTFGIAVRAGLEYAVTPWLSPSLRVEYDRLSTSLSPAAGAQVSADSSLDHRLFVDLGAAVHF